MEQRSLHGRLVTEFVIGGRNIWRGHHNVRAQGSLGTATPRQAACQVASSGSDTSNPAAGTLIRYADSIAGSDLARVSYDGGGGGGPRAARLPPTPLAAMMETFAHLPSANMWCDTGTVRISGRVRSDRAKDGLQHGLLASEKPESACAVMAATCVISDTGELSAGCLPEPAALRPPFRNTVPVPRTASGGYSSCMFRDRFSTSPGSIESRSTECSRLFESTAAIMRFRGRRPAACHLVQYARVAQAGVECLDVSHPDHCHVDRVMRGRRGVLGPERLGRRQCGQYAPRAVSKGDLLDQVYLRRNVWPVRRHQARYDAVPTVLGRRHPAARAAACTPQGTTPHPTRTVPARASRFARPTDTGMVRFSSGGVLFWPPPIPIRSKENPAARQRYRPLWQGRPPPHAGTRPSHPQGCQSCRP